jgi:hypothetical protein
MKVEFNNWIINAIINCSFYFYLLYYIILYYTKLHEHEDHDHDHDIINYFINNKLIKKFLPNKRSFIKIRGDV